MIDPQLLMENTSYGYDCYVNTPVIVNFWKLFNEYDNNHRVLYLRFVWGRSRLPICSKDFNDKHEITLLGKNDAELPQSHTCFF